MDAESMFWVGTVVFLAFAALRTQVVSNADAAAMTVLVRASMAAKDYQTFAEAHLAIKLFMERTLTFRWVLTQAATLTRWKFADFHPEIAEVARVLDR